MKQVYIKRIPKENRIQFSFWIIGSFSQEAEKISIINRAISSLPFPKILLELYQKCKYVLHHHCHIFLTLSFFCGWVQFLIKVSNLHDTCLGRNLSKPPEPENPLQQIQTDSAHGQHAVLVSMTDFSNSITGILPQVSKMWLNSTLFCMY